MLCVSESARGVLAPMLLLAVCAPADAQIKFTDVSTAANIGAELYDANTNHGLGSAWIDINKDGYPDIFSVNGKGLKAHLYLNRGDGSFKLRDDLLPALPNVEMPAAVYADYDNDGDSDIYIITDNEVNSLTPSPPSPEDGPPNILLKSLWVENGNQSFPGTPLFVNVAAAAGVDDLAPSPFPSVTGSNYPGYRAIATSWLDFDRDGWVDLYVGHWSCHNQFKLSCWDRVFRNKHDGTFEDVTAALGLPGPTDTANMRATLVAVGAHLDQDLWPDMYWGNVGCGLGNLPPSAQVDLFWRNNGKGGFVASNNDSPGMCDDAFAAMGIAVGDLDLDGAWDMYIADIFNTSGDALPLGNPLYVGNGNGTFKDNIADVAGVAQGTSWSVNFIDAELDGDEDIFVASAGPSSGANILYENAGNLTFNNVSSTANVAAGGVFDARGSSLADYDRDGDLDILVNYDQDVPMQLLRNDSISTNHWLGVGLTATLSNRDAIGTVIKISAGGKQMMRQVTGGIAAHSQNSLFSNFGVGSATKIDLLTVLWPSGVVTYLKDVAADQYVQVVENPTGIVGYGDACSGGSHYSPALMVSGDISPGGTVTMDVVSARGGGALFYAFGNARASNPAAGCSLLVAGPVGILYAGQVQGLGDGLGVFHDSLVIPVATSPSLVTLQAFVADPGIPTGMSATNGIEVTLFP